MKIIFTISSQTDPDFNRELSFDKFPVTIGRDENSSVRLQDPKKTVSRSHARIHMLNEELKIVDLNSRNFTFLNDQKLLPETDYPLEDGSIIKISDFTILASIEKHDKTASDDRTMLFSNPFSEEVDKFSESVRQLLDKYRDSNDDFKKEALQLGLINAFSSSEKCEAGSIIAQHLASQFLSAQNFQAGFPLKEIGSEIKPVQLNPAKNPKDTSGGYSFRAQVSRIYDVMFDVLTKLMQGFWHFRQEFFGVTIYQTLPANNIDSLKEFLFSENISIEEEEKRLRAFEDEIQKILSHQMGLLEGYRLSHEEGIKELLQSINPDSVESEIRSQNIKLGPLAIPCRFIPFYVRFKSVRILKQRHSGILSDLNSAEKKFFRQPFMKAYQSRLSKK